MWGGGRPPSPYGLAANVANDDQQSLAQFEWLLALFQISDGKPELSPVELKVCKNGLIWAKNLFQKNFPGYFYPPITVM